MAISKKRAGKVKIRNLQKTIDGIYDNINEVIIARSDKLHNLSVGDQIIVKNITCSSK